MKKLGITILGLISLTLCLLGTPKLIMPLSEAGFFYYIYAAFLLLGYIASILAVLQKEKAEKPIILFYALQTIFTYNNPITLELYAGLEYHLIFLSGTAPEAFQEPTGFAINLIGLSLLIISIKLFQRKTKNEKST